jgi:hypothetical protein
MEEAFEWTRMKDTDNVTQNGTTMSLLNDDIHLKPCNESRMSEP